MYATGGFSETNDCPSSLAVGATCTVTVGITPTQVQNYSGKLVINSDTPFAPDVVGLSGAVYNPNGNLALTATASADNTLAGFPAGNANDNNQAYLFSPTGTAGNNVVDISVPSTTMNYIRLDISNNDVQGAPQVAEFQVYSN